MFGALTGALLGLVLGMRHALEPDHLTAVSTLVVEQRSVRKGAWLGFCWGLGHTAALFAVACVLLLFDAKMPQRVADLFELGVAAMLVGLGLRSIFRSGPLSVTKVHSHLHTHAVVHPNVFRHRNVYKHSHSHSHQFATRSLLVGVVHGLAGSGALTVLVLAGLPTTAQRLGYILVFGLGSVGGMALLSAFAGVPLARVGRSARWSRGVILATGAFSTVLGVIWGVPLIGHFFAR